MHLYLHKRGIGIKKHKAYMGRKKQTLYYHVAPKTNLVPVIQPVKLDIMRLVSGLISINYFFGLRQTTK